MYVRTYLQSMYIPTGIKCNTVKQKGELVGEKNELVHYRSLIFCASSTTLVIYIYESIIFQAKARG